MRNNNLTPEKLNEKKEDIAKMKAMYQDGKDPTWKPMLEQLVEYLPQEAKKAVLDLEDQKLLGISNNHNPQPPENPAPVNVNTAISNDNNNSEVNVVKKQLPEGPLKTLKTNINTWEQALSNGKFDMSTPEGRKSSIQVLLKTALQPALSASNSGKLPADHIKNELLQLNEKHPGLLNAISVELKEDKERQTDQILRMGQRIKLEGLITQSAIPANNNPGSVPANNNPAPVPANNNPGQPQPAAAPAQILTDPQRDIKTWFQKIERQKNFGSKKMMEPKTDIENVLAGYHPRLDEKAHHQECTDIEKLRALPIGQHFNETGVGLLIKQTMDHFSNVFCSDPNQENAEALKEIFDRLIAPADIRDPEAIAKLYTGMVKTNPANSEIGEALFVKAMQYLVLKERERYSFQMGSTKLDPNDPNIQQTIADQNVSFTQHIQFIKNSINQKLQPNSRIRSNVMENMATYTNKVFEAAVQYENEYQTQKPILLNKIDSLMSILQEKDATPSKELERLKGKLEKAELLEDSDEVSKISEQIQQFEQGNADAIAAKENFAQEDRLFAELDTKMVAFLNQYPSVNPDALRETLETRRLEKLLSESQTSAHPDLIRENKQKLESYKAKRQYPDVPNFDQIAPDLANHVDQIGTLRAHIQEQCKERPAYKVKYSQLQYQRALSEYKAGLQENQNPSPILLANLQKSVNEAHKKYETTVKEANTKESYKTLCELSGPLNALRDKHYKFGHAQIDPLKMDDYQLNGKETPSILKSIDSETEQVNALLHERGRLEQIIEANPKLAPNYAKEINENTKQLKELMATLIKDINMAHKSGGFMATHPDAEEYARQVAILQESLHTFRENNRFFFNSLTQLGNTYGNQKGSWLNPIKGSYLNKLGGLITGGAKESVETLPKNIFGDSKIKYDTEAAKSLNGTVTSESYEQIDLYQWRKIPHTADIEFPDGKKVTEKVTFKKEEFKDIFTGFCKEHGIDPLHSTLSKLGNRYGVKVTESSTHITYKWPSVKLKQAWLDHLKEKYINKRQKELEKEHQAGAKIQNPDKNEAIAASMPQAGNAPTKVPETTPQQQPTTNNNNEIMNFPSAPSIQQQPQSNDANLNLKNLTPSTWLPDTGNQQNWITQGQSNQNIIENKTKNETENENLSSDKSSMSPGYN